MYDKKSNYAINKKDPEAIVYTDADRRVIRLTRADFDTEADFLKWKAWSDENYHDEEKSDHVEDNHTTPLDERAGAVDGPEIVIEQRIEKRTREQYAAETVIRVKGQLTKKQFRRLWMYWVKGMTQQQIAEAEAVGQQRISTSIKAATRRIKKYFSGVGKK